MLFIIPGIAPCRDTNKGCLKVSSPLKNRTGNIALKKKRPSNKGTESLPWPPFFRKFNLLLVSGSVAGCRQLEECNHRFRCILKYIFITP